MRAIQEKVFALDVMMLMQLGFNASLEHECTTFDQRRGIPCERRFEALDVETEQAVLMC